MRRGLFLLLIVLTALRGLAGPAMAASHVGPATVESAASVAHAVHAAAGSAAPSAAHHSAAAPKTDASAPGCHGASAQHGDATGTANCAAHDGGGAAHPHAACADCEICHTAVAAPPAGPGAVLAAAGPAPDRHSTRFASAPAAQAIKPPIA